MTTNLLHLARPRDILVAIGVVALVAGCASAPESSAPGPQGFPAPPDPARFYYERTLLGTGSVRQLDSTDRMRKILTGTTAREGIGFAKPFDVVVHRGRLFVSDTVHRLVLAMDFGSGRSFVIGDRGDDGDLFKPLGLAVDDAGNLYVTDTSLKAIQVYDRDGNYLRKISVKGQLDRPSGIDVSPDGSRLFVVDTGGVDSRNHHLVVFDARTGQKLRVIGGRGSAPGKLNLPRDVHLGRDDLLYVTDGGNFRVQAFTQDGQYVRAWGEPGRRLGQFSRPKGIAVDKEGNVYAADAAFGNFQIFTPEGKLLLFIGNRSTRPGPAKFMLPAGIDVDEDGRVYMVDQYYRKIDVFRPASLAETAGYFGGGLAGEPE